MNEKSCIAPPTDTFNWITESCVCQIWTHVSVSLQIDRSVNTKVTERSAFINETVSVFINGIVSSIGKDILCIHKLYKIHIKRL